MRPTPARTFIIPAALVLVPFSALIARGGPTEGAARPAHLHEAVIAATSPDTGRVPLGRPVSFEGLGARADAASRAVPLPLIMPEARAAAAAAAHERLSLHVPRSSHQDALRLALQAYFNYRSANPELVRKPYLYFVDLGLDNRTARGWVFDMDALQVVDGPFHVAHGVGSSRQRDGVPTVFSNRPGSKASSLGLYLAEETYRFSGRAGGGAYSSIGLRMRGESGGFNDAARRRGVVAHGAPYVTRADAGRSEGCPAMEQHRAQRLLPLLADGGVVFIFSPRDPVWLHADPWLATE